MIMMKFRTFSLALAVVALVAGLARITTAGCGTCDKSVVENAAADASFSTLVTAVKAKDVVGLKEAKTVNGKSVTIAVKEGEVMIDGAKVVKTDIASKNGVIHGIDTVILPKE